MTMNFDHVKSPKVRHYLENKSEATFKNGVRFFTVAAKSLARDEVNPNIGYAAFAMRDDALKAAESYLAANNPEELWHALRDFWAH